MPPKAPVQSRCDREIGEAVASVFAAWCEERENFSSREHSGPDFWVDARTDGYHIYGPDDCILARQPGPATVPDLRPVLLNDRPYKKSGSPYHVRRHVRHLLLELGMPFEPVRPVRPHGPYLVTSSDLVAWWKQIRAVRELFDYAATARALVAAWLKGENADRSVDRLNRATTREDLICGTDRVLVCRAPRHGLALVLDARLARGTHNARLRAALETELIRKGVQMIRVGVPRHTFRDDRELMIEAWETRRRLLHLETP